MRWREAQRGARGRGRRRVAAGVADAARRAEHGSVGWGLATVAALACSGLFVGAALLTLGDEGRRFTRLDLPADVTKCKHDADCVLVDQIGCCTCEAGGARWAVSAGHRDTLRRFLKHSCPRPAACLQVDSCRRDLVAACVEHRCAAVSHG